MAFDTNQFLSKAEDVADQVLRQGKHVLPHIARLCLLSTFIEDGLRMWFQWSDQARYMDDMWGVGTVIGNIFVIINLLGQLVPSGMIVARKFVNIAIYVLMGVVVLQTFAYGIVTEIRFLMRNIALVGGLLLLLAECHHERKAIFADVPSLGSVHNTKTYFQLTGRILIIFLFISLFHFDQSVIQLVMMLLEAALMACVAVGYKTKLSALILCVWLFCVNFYFNNFWTIPASRVLRDFLKYDFFQTLSVIGGLLMVVALGAGGLSMDEQKKKW